MNRKKRYNLIEKYLRKHLQVEAVLHEGLIEYGVVEVLSQELVERVRRSPPSSKAASLKEPKKRRSDRSLEDIVAQPGESFSRMLFRLIRELDVDEVDTYKKARIDRKLFSKIRSNDNYKPGKTTALSLALALKLSLDDTLDLLGKAGYTLSHSSRADLIIEYFIEEGVYDLFEINETLDAFGQPPI